MSIEHELKESIEDGVEDGIVKAVEKLIHKGLIEEITQNIIDVVVLNILRAIETSVVIEKIIKLISSTELQQIQSLILKILKCKFEAIEDNELIDEVNKISNLDKIDIIIKSILEGDSLDAIKDLVKRANSPD
jgi:uncharacterized protein (UPF0371 family)